MKRITKFLAVAVLLIGVFLGSTSSTRAGSFTQEVDLAWATIPVFFQNYTFGALPGRPSGALTSVTFSVQTSWAVTNQITNPTGTPQPGNAAASVFSLSIESSGSTNIANVFSSGYIIHKTVTYSTLFTERANSVTNFTTIASYGTNQVFNSTNYDLSEFLSPTTLQLDTFASASDSFNAGQDAKLFGHVSFQAKFIYDYSGVLITPEPSAGILFGMGGLACCGWQFSARKRRNCNRLADSIEA